MDPYNVSLGASYASLYTVMVAFTVLALVTSSFIPVPAFIGKYLVASNGKTTVASGDEAGDFFLSARNSANARTIAMSFFAGGMGAWVLYATAEMGANPDLSWLGVIGYSSASAFPAVVIGIIGPKVREVAGENGFTAIDFAYLRFGRSMQLVVSAVSVFYMFIYIVAELTSIANVYALLVNKSTFGEANVDYTRHIAIAMCAFTVFYTSVGGLPASISTDKVQAVIVVALVIILFFAVVLHPDNEISKEQYDVASNATVDGFMAMVTLFIAILSAEMFNQSNWQRVWAAESVTALRRGYFYASVPVFLTMMFFGIMGMIAFAKDPSSYRSFEKLSYLSFFDLLAPLSQFWHVLVLVLTTAFAASSIDSLQTGIVGVFNKDILKLTSSGKTGKWVSRLLLLLVNIPAVIMSTKRFDVIPLFLVADLVCATTVLPLFFGLMQENWGFIKAPTEFGSVMGSICGIFAVLINGAVLNVDKAVNWNGDVLATGPFAYFWLTNGDICALCGPKTMITFIITPLVGGFFALFFSMLDILVRGEENARKPMCFASAKNEIAQKESLDVVKEESIDVVKEEAC